MTRTNPLAVLGELRLAVFSFHSRIDPSSHCVVPARLRSRALRLTESRNQKRALCLTHRDAILLEPVHSLLSECMHYATQITLLRLE
jgi:hypothetical protein